MNTIHDVLRFILGRLRGVASDQQIEQAFAAVAAHEAGQATGVPAVPATFAEAFPQAADQLSRLDTTTGQLAAQVGDLAAQVTTLATPAQAAPTVPDPVPPAAFSPPVHNPEQGDF